AGVSAAPVRNSFAAAFTAVLDGSRGSRFPHGLRARGAVSALAERDDDGVVHGFSPVGGHRKCPPRRGSIRLRALAPDRASSLCYSVWSAVSQQSCAAQMLG